MTVNKELDHPAIDLSVQVVIVMDAAGNFKAETTGANGSRIKIDLPADFRASNPELVCALIERQDQKRAEAERKTRKTQNANLSYILTQSCGPNINPSIQSTRRQLAKTCYPDAERMFSARWRKHLHGQAGNLSDGKSSKPAPDFSNLI